MTNVQRSIAQARLRIFLQSWLTMLGWLSLGGLLLGGLLMLAARLVGVPVPGASYLVTVGFVLVVAPLVAWGRRPGADVTATVIDHRLNLKDRLGTALYAEAIRDNEFAAQVVEDAEDTASKLHLRDGFPIQLRKVWHYVPLVAALVAMLAAFVPQMDLLGWRSARAQRLAQQTQARTARDEVVRVIEAFQKLPPTDPELVDQDLFDAMKTLAELTRQDLSNPKMRQEAAAKLSAVQDKLAKQIEQTEQEFRSVKNTMSRLDAKQPGPADEFADALRRGDFEAAQAALEQLAQSLDGMTPQQKQALQQQLQNMSQQLQQMAQQQAQQAAQARQQMQQQLQNTGLSQQQMQQLMQQGMNQQAVQQALQQQGMSQQQAQQLAQQMQQQYQQMQRSGQSQSQYQGLGNSLGQMAGACQGGGGSQAMQPSAFQGGQQLQQMAQMQQQLQQMQMAQAQANNALNSLYPGQGQTRQAGTGEGGNPFGDERQMTGIQANAEADIGEGEGRVIASWLDQGQMARGDATVEFNQAITQARDDAEQAVTEDRVPRRYHESIRQYFNQLPESADQVRAPAAPR